MTKADEKRVRELIAEAREEQHQQFISYMVLHHHKRLAAPLND